METRRNHVRGRRKIYFEPFLSREAYIDSHSGTTLEEEEIPQKLPETSPQVGRPQIVREVGSKENYS